jgi:ferric-dicitrate binding protein FerR (iron transport regulator)
MKPKTDIDKHLLKNLEAFRSIDIEDDWQKLRGQMGFRKQRSMRYLWQTAAAVIMLLGVGFLTQKLVFPTPHMLTVQSGMQMKEVVLPDGSSVTMNRQAELVYPEKFNRKQRKLKLVGEAFFEVVSNPDSPFVVDVDHKALVQVLGTSFNISPDENGESISVQVVEGRVAFSSTLRGSDRIILTKDEQATLTAGTITRTDTVSLNFLSWKTGTLFFDHAFLKDVFKQLEAHYEIDIVMQKSVPRNLTLTSILDNQDLDSVLDEISMVLGLDYSYEDDKVVFTLSE